MKYLAVFSCFVLIATDVACVFPGSEEAALYDSFLRLHIIANSDSEDDQALKLKVRDAVLETMASLTEGCTTVGEAEAVFRANQSEIKEAAEKTVAENGCSYKIEVTLGEEYYPTREYDGLSLPAGIYKSARVLIGEAEGHNWWCILFPPLCVDAAKAHEKLVAAGFSQNQIRILTDGDNVKYKLKFKALEIIEQILASLRGENE